MMTKSDIIAAIEGELAMYRTLQDKANLTRQPNQWVNGNIYALSRMLTLVSFLHTEESTECRQLMLPFVFS